LVFDFSLNINSINKDHQSLFLAHLN